VAAQSQTYIDLFNFDGVHGANPSYPELLAQGRDGDLYGTAPFGYYSEAGVVFRSTPGGASRIVHGFRVSDGNHPYGGLTLGEDGEFYGTTALGGSNEDGTVFKITSNGALVTLYSFTAADPQPQAPPIQAADGYFYATSSTLAYKVTSQGIYTALGSIPGDSYGPLLQATDENLYGTTWNGGTSQNGTVFKVEPSGAVTTVVDFDFAHGSAPYGPLIQASDGNFYGTTTAGGSNKQGVVFRLTPQRALTVMHSFPDPSYSNDGTAPEAGLVQASDGNLYGVTGGGGSLGYGVLFEITLAGNYSILYNFDLSTGGNPGSTPTQHTNGTIYGMTEEGGADNQGVLYSFNMGLPSFAKLLPAAGRVGRVVDILGQGFTSTTSVSFNGTTAAFKVQSDTFLRAIVPSGATTGVVTITTQGGMLSSNQAFRVTQ